MHGNILVPYQSGNAVVDIILWFAFVFAFGFFMGGGWTVVTKILR
jgi:hypothetical protein